MENTGKVLFEDDTPRWYVSIGPEQWVGPMSASDIYEKIETGELTWAHFIWRKGQGTWERVCDVAEFRAAVPEKPKAGGQKELAQAMKPEVKKAVPRKAPRSEPRIWFLYYNDSQFGPFSTSEIDRYLRIGKIYGRVHAWRDGMLNWERLETVAAFKDACSEAERAYRERKKGRAVERGAAAGRGGVKAEQREHPRKPLVARITMANQDSVIVGVCRDISVGGMQVLTDRIPGVSGNRIKINVSPSGTSSFEPFVAEGVIVRILEDGRGFSFRFERISDRARSAIEGYIS